MASYFDPDEIKKGIRLDIARYKRPSFEATPCHAKAAGLYMTVRFLNMPLKKRLFRCTMYDYRGQVAEATGLTFFHSGRKDSYADS